MIIEVPFKYEVVGVEKGKRSSSYLSGYSSVSVNIPEIHRDDMETALVLYDRNAAYTQTFLKHDGSFYIRDRATDAEPFTRHHHMLVGHWPRKAGALNGGRNAPLYTKASAETDNRKMTDGLGRIGILQFMSVSPDILRIESGQGIGARFEDKDGSLTSVAMSPETELRTVEVNTLEQRRHETSLYALKNVIAIDGELYHSVAPPLIHVTKTKADWYFSETLLPLPDHTSSYYSETYDMSSSRAWRMPMTEHESLHDAFPGILANDGLNFHVDLISPACFDKPDLREPLVKDITAALTEGAHLQHHETTFILKWCELRDLLAGRRNNLAEQPDDILDRAAEIMGEMETLENKSLYPAARLWLDRNITFDVDVVPSHRP